MSLDLEAYRATYPVDYWTKVAEESGHHCSAPLGAVLAVNALCDEVEQLARQRDELLAALVNSRNALESANEIGDGPICDTIWYGRAETLFGYMDAEIAKCSTAKDKESP